MAICPSCGRDQVRSSAFCPYCGAVLDRPAGVAVPDSSNARPETAAANAAAPPPAPPPTKQAHDVGDVGAYIVRRLLALTVDLVVVGALVAVGLRAWLARATPGGGLSASGFLQLVVLVVAVLFAYRWLFEGVVGSTLGKLVFGLAVGRRGGGSAGLGRAFWRNLLLPIDLALIGFLVAAVTPQRRRLGDLIAGTLVGNSRSGALAPVLGVTLLGAAAYGVYAYAGGLGAARHLAHDAAELAPTLINAATPGPTIAPAPPPSPMLAPSASPSPPTT